LNNFCCLGLRGLLNISVIDNYFGDFFKELICSEVLPAIEASVML